MSSYEFEGTIMMDPENDTEQKFTVTFYYYPSCHDDAPVACHDEMIEDVCVYKHGHEIILTEEQQKEAEELCWSYINGDEDEDSDEDHGRDSREMFY